jgi:hypothetical protein
MLVLAGALLLALGIASGLLLALAPFGLVAPAPGAALWILFPLFTAAGYLLLALPAPPKALVVLSKIAGGILLALAVLAGLGLFAAASDALHAKGSTLALWYVLGLGLLLGVAGLSAHRPAGHAPAAGAARS